MQKLTEPVNMVRTSLEWSLYILHLCEMLPVAYFKKMLLLAFPAKKGGGGPDYQITN
jgi:hypothetical protein